MERRGLFLIPDVGELTLFAGCDRRELARIRSLVTPIALPAGAIVIERGITARQFAVIADGEVTVEDEQGDEVAVLGPGDIVGELGLLQDRPTDSTVRTLTPVIAYVGSRLEFASLLAVAARIDLRITHTALDRLRRVS